MSDSTRKHTNGQTQQLAIFQLDAHLKRFLQSIRLVRLECEYTLEDLRALYQDLPCCYACFSGEYPTGASEELLRQIEQEKECSTRN